MEYRAISSPTVTQIGSEVLPNPEGTHAAELIEPIKGPQALCLPQERQVHKTQTMYAGHGQRIDTRTQRKPAKKGESDRGDRRAITSARLSARPQSRARERDAPDGESLLLRHLHAGHMLLLVLLPAHHAAHHPAALLLP